MTLDPIFAAPAVVQFHLATVVPAFFIGTWLIFFSTKGSRPHRAAGFVYLGLMTATAVAAIFIHATDLPNFLGFTPIHLFVPLTFFGVSSALINVRRGNIAGHRIAMLGLYIGAILIAGTLAFLPGRVLHAVFFS